MATKSAIDEAVPSDVERQREMILETFASRAPQDAEADMAPLSVYFMLTAFMRFGDSLVLMKDEPVRFGEFASLFDSLQSLVRHRRTSICMAHLLLSFFQNADEGDPLVARCFSTFGKRIQALVELLLFYVVHYDPDKEQQDGFLGIVRALTPELVESWCTDTHQWIVARICDVLASEVPVEDHAQFLRLAFGTDWFLLRDFGDFCLLRLSNLRWLFIAPIDLGFKWSSREAQRDSVARLCGVMGWTSLRDYRSDYRLDEVPATALEGTPFHSFWVKMCANRTYHSARHDDGTSLNSGSSCESDSGACAGVDSDAETPNTRVKRPGAPLPAHTSPKKQRNLRLRLK
jgi:hypothetical protein